MDAGGNNRYELLFMDDADNATATQPAPEVQKKPAAPPKAKAPGTATAAKKPNVQANKENKNSAVTKETAANKKAAAPKQSNAPAAANKGARPPATGANANERSGTMQERRNVSFKQDNEVREQRNNRRNLRNDEFGNAGQQRPFRENRENRENRGNFRNREGGNFRGKREFDRQSGSDKTGVKAIDKRDGAGAHNWGSVKQEIENVDITATDADATLTDKEENEVNENAAETVAVPEEEQVKEMTLDEYKALRQQREKPKYNIRKPGEGEDNAQWKKMVVLSKKKDVDSEEEFEFDPSMYPQRVGRLQRIVDIQFNFKDGRRGGGNFGGRGRGPRGDKGRFERGDRNENTGARNDSNNKQRNFGDRQQNNNNKSGIKIDYESQFPTLG